MENQNKKCREQYVKAERKRLIKLSDTAYRLDPRVKAHLAKEAAEKEAKKQAIREAKQAKQREIEEKIKAEEEAERKKKEEEEEQKKREAEAKKEAVKKWRGTVKEIIIFASKKMPGTNYDKFYFGELVKKFPKQEELEEFFDKMKAIEAKTPEEYIEQYEQMVSDKKEDVQKEKEEKEKKLKEIEEQKQADAALLKGDWTPEDIGMLTKGIVKFPPGTVNRWKVIADYVGKSQK